MAPLKGYYKGSIIRYYNIGALIIRMGGGGWVYIYMLVVTGKYNLSFLWRIGVVSFGFDWDPVRGSRKVIKGFRV